MARPRSKPELRVEALEPRLCLSGGSSGHGDPVFLPIGHGKALAPFVNLGAFNIGEAYELSRLVEETRAAAADDADRVTGKFQILAAPSHQLIVLVELPTASDDIPEPASQTDAPAEAGREPLDVKSGQGSNKDTRGDRLTAGSNRNPLRTLGQYTAPVQVSAHVIDFSAQPPRVTSVKAELAVLKDEGEASVDHVVVIPSWLIRLDQSPWLRQSLTKSKKLNWSGDKLEQAREFSLNRPEKRVAHRVQLDIRSMGIRLIALPESGLSSKAASPERVAAWDFVRGRLDVIRHMVAEDLDQIELSSIRSGLAGYRAGTAQTAWQSSLQPDADPSAAKPDRFPGQSDQPVRRQREFAIPVSIQTSQPAIQAAGIRIKTDSSPEILTGRIVPIVLEDRPPVESNQNKSKPSFPAERLMDLVLQELYVVPTQQDLGAEQPAHSPAVDRQHGE